MLNCYRTILIFLCLKVFQIELELSYNFFENNILRFNSSNALKNLLPNNYKYFVIFHQKKENLTKIYNNL